MTRFALIVLFLSCTLGRLFADSSYRDPLFDHVPFDRWLSETGRSHIRWNARVSEAELSIHQRLLVRVEVEVDGAELARRRGRGRFYVLVEVNDEKGRASQNHQEMDLERLEAGIKGNDAIFSQRFFVLPGDYNIAIAIFATATGEHSVIQRKLRVSPLKKDPLPGAWRDLPAVEFLSSSMPPDNWYLPSIEGKLRLAVETREPVHVNLLVNLTPSERLTGSSRVQNRNLAALLPITKILSQVDWRNNAFSLALLDLSRRRVTYEQNDSQELDWPKASSSLTEVTPGVIDVKSLENRKQTAEFFVDQIGRRIGKRHGTPVLIVLSSAVAFDSDQQMRPVAFNSTSTARTFYIRYQPLPQIAFGPGRLRTRMPGAPLPPRANYPGPIDQLAPLLKSLDPRLFEIATPEQFRKALATILNEIAKL